MSQNILCYLNSLLASQYEEKLSQHPDKGEMIIRTIVIPKCASSPVLYKCGLSLLL